MAMEKEPGTRHSSLSNLRCLSAVLLLLAVVQQAEGFYCATGRVGGGVSRCRATSSSRQGSSSRWSSRPSSSSYSIRSSSRNILRASTIESRDKEAPGEGKEVDVTVDTPPVAAAAPAALDDEKNEGGAEGSGEDKDTAPVESRTVQLSKRVEAEGKMADARAQRMANLNSELKRSFAKKEEVENMIVSEIGQLGTKLRQERDIEIARAADLKELLVEFGETIAEKQEQIEKEQELLAQMQGLRGQVSEASIRAPIEDAMAKKADVTSIEVMLLEDLVECKEKLEKELESTISRGETMEGVVAALPAEDDAVRMRAYNWQDVQDLQEVLLSSVESMEESDAQVGSLRARLLDSVAQKREVLGEASSSTELVLGGGGGGVTRKMTTAMAFQASTELSEEELLDAVAESSKSTAMGVAKSVTAGANSFGSYLRSAKGQDVAASAVLVIGAVAGAAGSVTNAVKVAKEEFDKNAKAKEEMTSFDKIISSFQSSIKAVTESSKVKAELNEAGKLLTKQVPEAGARVGKGATEAIKGAASNPELGNPIKEVLSSLEQLVVSVAALGTKYFSVSRESRFQLPGGSSAESEEQKRANSKLPSASPPPKSMEELTAEKEAAAAVAAAAAAVAPQKESVEGKKQEESAPTSPVSAASGKVAEPSARKATPPPPPPSVEPKAVEKTPVPAVSEATTTLPKVESEETEKKPSTPLASEPKAAEKTPAPASEATAPSDAVESASAREASK